MPLFVSVLLVVLHVRADIDGSYIGTTFPHLFLMTFPSAIPPPTTMLYVPRVFGFRIHSEKKAPLASSGRVGVDGRAAVEGVAADAPAAPAEEEV